MPVDEVHSAFCILHSAFLILNSDEQCSPLQLCTLNFELCTFTDEQWLPLLLIKIPLKIFFTFKLIYAIMVYDKLSEDNYNGEIVF